ncbi:hypothetical protein ACIBEJ_10300 [Nonomuraea sp. NPDC050790]|uniref:hypothetical protein n=1 Tax=Nonomuraea sp. NPDC050790 TaxID=3364371 RepID=UPI0037970832
MHTLKNFFSVVHRAIWRLGIVFLLSVAFAVAMGPYGPSDPFSLLFIYLPLEVIHIIQEYRNPRPDLLGASDPKIARFGFSFLAILATAAWLLTHRSFAIELLLVLIAILAAYIFRPRTKASS